MAYKKHLNGKSKKDELKTSKPIIAESQMIFLILNILIYNISNFVYCTSMVVIIFTVFGNYRKHEKAA